MIHVYKAGGDWTSPGGVKYTVKAVSSAAEYLADGWVMSLAEVADEIDSSGVDHGNYERELRDKIKALGGKPAGRSSVAKLEEQLTELEAE